MVILTGLILTGLPVMITIITTIITTIIQLNKLLLSLLLLLLLFFFFPHSIIIIIIFPHSSTLSLSEWSTQGRSEACLRFRADWATSIIDTTTTPRTSSTEES